jgi:hypothetical protein
MGAVKSQIETRLFRIPRTVLARLGAEEYLLHFWWLVLGFPLYGLWALLLSGTDALRLTGMVALAWPLTVPARAVLSTNKGDTLFFVPEGGDGFRLAIASVIRLVTRNGFYILRLRRLGFVAVPQDAFVSDEDRTQFEQLVGQRDAH